MHVNTSTWASKPTGATSAVCDLQEREKKNCNDTDNVGSIKYFLMICFSWDHQWYMCKLYHAKQLTLHRVQHLQTWACWLEMVSDGCYGCYTRKTFCRKFIKRSRLLFKVECLGEIYIMFTDVVFVQIV